MKKVLHILMPADRRRVVDPATRKSMPVDGLVVDAALPLATYWMRRLAEGDVKLLTRPAQTGAEAPANPAGARAGQGSETP